MAVQLDWIINRYSFVRVAQQEAVHMEQTPNTETQLAETASQEPALAQNCSNVLRRHIKENPMKAILARHRL